MSKRARLVIANKADLPASDRDPEEVRLVHAKLARLEEFVREMDHDGRVLDVVPTSGKYGQNLRSVVRKLWTYVEEARSAASRTLSTHIPSYITAVIDLVLRFSVSTCELCAEKIHEQSRIPRASSSALIRGSRK